LRSGDHVRGAGLQEDHEVCQVSAIELFEMMVKAHEEGVAYAAVNPNRLQQLAGRPQPVVVLETRTVDVRSFGLSPLSVIPSQEKTEALTHMAIHMDCHGVTDIGKLREVNEDQFLIADLRKSLHLFQTSLAMDDQSRLFSGSQGKLLLVADGVGGAAAGERASTLVVDSIAAYILNTLQWFFRLEEHGEEDFVEDLAGALKRSERDLAAEAEAIPQRHGMGTTLTMAYIVWPRLYIVHAGDSRCYLFHQRRLKQITTDHSYAQKFVDAGVIELDEAEQSRLSHLLWNVIGGKGAEVRPEAHKAGLSTGDSLLLCTDGLTNHVSDDKIAELLDSDLSAAELCQQLVDAANEAGGSDNITIVAARFREVKEPPELAGEEAVLAETAEESDSLSNTQSVPAT
jgi:protein phosphatase